MHGEDGHFVRRYDKQLRSFREVATDLYGYWGMAFQPGGERLAIDCLSHGCNPPTGNHAVIRVSDGMTVLRRFGGIPGCDEQGLLNPSGVAVNAAGDVFVADQGSGRLLKLSSGLDYMTEVRFPDISAVAVTNSSVVASSYDGMTIRCFDFALENELCAGYAGAFGVQSICFVREGLLLFATNSGLTAIDQSMGFLGTLRVPERLSNVRSIGVGCDGALYLSCRYMGLVKARIE